MAELDRIFEHQPAPIWIRGTTSIGDAIDNTLPGLQVQGSTPLLGGVATALDMFATANDRAIVLLSDGYHNCPEPVTETDPAVTDLIAALDKARDSYNTDVLSQVAATVALEHRAEASRSWGPSRRAAPPPDRGPRGARLPRRAQRGQLRPGPAPGGPGPAHRRGAVRKTQAAGDLRAIS